MTDYYYQTDYEDPPEDGRRPRRPTPADQYPADRAFFTGDRDDVVPGQDDLAIYDEPDHAGDEGDAPDGQDAAAYAPDQDTGYADEDDASYPLPAVMATESQSWDDEPYAADAELYPADEEPYAPLDAPAAAPAGHVSVASVGLAAERRIRFDPTQERGAGHYTSARRHSRLVSVLKFALPAVAVIGVLAFLGFVQFAPAPDEAVISLSGINVETESVTMQTPHISGFDGTRRAYEVRAARAIQDLSNPKIVTMEEIVARLKMDDGATAHLTATTGTYNDETKKMVLSKGITLETTNGYKANLEDAQVDIATSLMTSSKPLTITTSQATVKANAIEFKDNGKYVMFRNGVTVFFTPEDEAKDKAAPADAAAPAADAAKTPEAASGGST